MKNRNIKIYRNQLIKWCKGFGAICLTGALTYSGFLTFKKPVKKKSYKMLTQDGILVEIDPRAILKIKQKIKSEEIQDWVKK